MCVCVCGYADNNDTIELIDGKPHGLLSLLDSSCITPKATDETFVREALTAHNANARIRSVALVSSSKAKAKAPHSMCVRVRFVLLYKRV